ncbi:MAG: alpha/beta fold hydrolase [Patescibacteria group bacterium]|nr:alpha/beta fold hydrolase [Patescibacteria group bacterium]
MLAVSAAGCTSTGVTMRTLPNTPLSERLSLTSQPKLEPSGRTLQLLRVCNLAGEVQGDPRLLLEKLHAVIEQEPTADKVYAFAELAYLAGRQAESRDPAAAVNLYGASVMKAYEYLFDPLLYATRNPYDPQFRGACELYNGSLEALLRMANRHGELILGTTKTIHTAAGDCDVSTVLRDTRWQARDVDRFEFVSDYEIRGLKNHYRSHGLGVPLIAVRRSYEGEPAAAKHYPLDLSFPVTAFFRPLPSDRNPVTGQASRNPQFVLEFYDPLTTTATTVGDMPVTLESDFTTPLAYFLSKPEFQALATIGLLRPDELLKMRPDRPDPIMGLYMLEPYEPGKIPVVMVHGLWSSPMTWMEMFNDLRSSPQIRDHYQIWFYLYPTGQPFWISAAQLRADLAEARHTLDPTGREPALDQTVLVGHSMGGLISRLQTLNSRDDLWRLVANTPLASIEAAPEVRQNLASAFYFAPSPSVSRVVTIGTPHRGSDFSNQTTQWLMSKLIRLPNMLVQPYQKLYRDNPGRFADGTLLKIENSIDSLSPKNPAFEAMLAAQRAPWVRYHNIVGRLPTDSFVSRVSGTGDGVVRIDSARLEEAVSELVVQADHSTIHAHPAAVLEVRRILLEHLAELRGPTVAAAAAVHAADAVYAAGGQRRERHPLRPSYSR